MREGDLIIITIGDPTGRHGGTNAMKIVRVGGSKYLNGMIRLQLQHCILTTFIY